MDIYKLDNKVVIDDYAHHPTEIESVLNTIQTNYKNKSKAVIFQPHLFSRTRDLMDEFAIVLSKFDEVYLLDIYPAREKPIIGVSSQILLEKIMMTLIHVTYMNHITQDYEHGSAKARKAEPVVEAGIVITPKVNVLVNVATEKKAKVNLSAYQRQERQV